MLSISQNVQQVYGSFDPRIDQFLTVYGRFRPVRREYGTVYGGV